MKIVAVNLDRVSRSSILQFMPATTCSSLPDYPRLSDLAAERHPGAVSAANLTCAAIRSPAVDPYASLLQPAALDELGGDHIALDLVRALADDHQRRIAEVALDVVLGRVAIPTMDAHGI